MREEGWYVDPYGIHDARWFSSGEPTKLVRDGATESSDPAPHEPPPRPLTRVAEPSAAGPDDLLRAGDAERPPDGGDMIDAAMDVFPQTGPTT